ncbi:MAG: hypothetical protein EPO62_01155 [Candidatus Nitrosotenuis sp.]|nr:MAG: hypothetical protein EPO62_01155 [Candidatus Nitrosotenuis sp.]
MDLSEKSKKEIASLFFKNCCLETNSTAYLICDALYSAPSDQRQLIEKILQMRKNLNVIRVTICELQSKNIIRSTNSRLELTDIGNWYYVAKKIGVSISSLCLLSQAYVIQKSLENSGNTGYFAVVHFADIVKYSHSPVKLIRNLREVGLIYRHHKNTIRIFPEKMKILERYDAELTSLNRWVVELKSKIDDIKDHDPVARENFIRNLECYAKLHKSVTVQ